MKQFHILLIICIISITTSCASSRPLLGEPVVAGNSLFKMNILELDEGPHFYSVGNKHSRYMYFPENPGEGFIWMTLDVSTNSGTVQDFDFKRIRIISEKSIKRASFIINPSWFDPTGQEGFFIQINPKEHVKRVLIFTYVKGFRPYRLVYDAIVNNKVDHKIATDLPDIYKK